MKTCLVPLLAILAVAVLLLSCGTSKHMLMSVSISPATADAVNYPNGQVQFTATGYYTSKPTPVTPFSATWGACDSLGFSTTAVTVSPTGEAQCGSGASGVFAVWGYGSNAEGGVCGAVNACGGGCGRVTGTALLTCPWGIPPTEARFQISAPTRVPISTNGIRECRCDAPRNGDLIPLLPGWFSPMDGSALTLIVPLPPDYLSFSATVPERNRSIRPPVINLIRIPGGSPFSVTKQKGRPQGRPSN